MSSATLLCSCTDRTGIVAGLSDFVFRHGGNIIDLDQHSETDAEGGQDRFFMRLVWSLDGFALDREGIGDALRVLAKAFDLNWTLAFDDRRQRVAIFCGKEPHCISDLLLRQEMGELAGDITLVVSNHTKLKRTATQHDIEFLHTPFEPENRQIAEAAQMQALEERGIDLIVLAKYMRILSPEFCKKWSGRIINIHHSFLPAFAGARPYRQAREKGVKIIGATAHYVTADLDQGAIIEQDVTRVTHKDEVRDLVRKGRDIERQVLGRAVRLHLERRVLVDGNRTIVFS